MKYKLIKEYPGSPELGKIIETQSYSIYPSKEIYNVIDYQEFWQPVVEKNYEILSYKNDEYIVNINLDYCSKRNLSIHSVKRLSDGEIFTIGDRINNKNYSHSLDKIILHNNEILLQHNFATWKMSHNLEDVQKAKQKLFISEDGVDIFEGDLCTTVTKYKFSIANKSWKPQIDTLYQLKDNDLIAFSTKEKAEKYIIMNKPCLSINDINMLKNIVFANWDKTLKELVKSKIKQSV